VGGVETETESFFRRWWQLIVFGSIAVAVLVACWLTIAQLADSPIIEPYSEVVRAFALQSPRSRERLVRLESGQLANACPAVFRKDEEP
jgi:hypothetical protein